jgi:hypothetical protein
VVVLHPSLPRNYNYDCANRGDQIGRMIDYWAFVYRGHFLLQKRPRNFFTRARPELDVSSPDPAL